MQVSEYKKKTNFYTVLLWVLIAVIFAVTLFDTIYLYKASHKQIENHLNDVSTQVVNTIDQRIHYIIKDLELIADFITQFEGENRFRYLTSRKTAQDFTDIGIIELDGSAKFLSGAVMTLENSQGFQHGLSGQRSVELYEKTDTVLYTVPIFDQAGGVTSMIVAQTDKFSMDELIQTDSFEGGGLVRIINSKGKLLFSSGNQTLVGKLDEKYGNSGNEPWAKKLLEDLQEDRAGFFKLTTTQHIEYMASYAPIMHNLNDWSFLLLVQTNSVLGQLKDLTIYTAVSTSLILILIAIIFTVLILIRKKYLKQIEQIAYKDPVTGGINDIKFRELAGERIPAAPPDTYAMAAINMKKFKLINNSFGSDRGNDTLHYVYRILNQSCRYGDELVYRHNADYFYYLMRNAPEEELLSRLQKIDEVINAFNEGMESPYYLRASVGIYVIHDPKEDLISIQDYANVARKSAGESYHTSYRFYREQTRQRLLKEKKITNLMEKALDNHEFLVYLQPKVDVYSYKITGAEALIRWNNPEKGMIYPNEFIPIFERNGFICRTDLYVFEETCRLLERWYKEDRELFPLSVNVSRQHLKKTDFLDDFRRIFAKYDFPPELLELELTESTILGNPAQFTDIINQIHQCGFRCSIDDFGFGYSSLSILKNFKVDALKLDRSFFTDQKHQSRGKAVITSIVELSHKLGMETVAEGIEEPKQLEFLKEINCTKVQGYVFSKPLPIPEFESFTFDGKQVKTCS